MMIIGILLFLSGLFLVLNHKNDGMVGFCLCKRDDKALEILKERYARGELTSDEFTTMKNVLAEK